MGNATQFQDPFNTEGNMPGSPGLRATWWLVKAVSLVMLMYLLFAWSWYLDVASGRGGQPIRVVDADEWLHNSVNLARFGVIDSL